MKCDQYKEETRKLHNQVCMTEKLYITEKCNTNPNQLKWILRKMSESSEFVYCHVYFYECSQGDKVVSFKTHLGRYWNRVCMVSMRIAKPAISTDLKMSQKIQLFSPIDNDLEVVASTKAFLVFVHISASEMTFWYWIVSMKSWLQQ